MTQNQNKSFSEFSNEIQEELDKFLHQDTLNNDASSIQKISDLLLNNVHLQEANKVIGYITLKHFKQEKQNVEEKNIKMQKKYIFFYIAHDLIFRTRQMKFQNMEIESSSLEQEKLKFSYIYAIGDHLIQWVTHLVLEMGETDYIRLNEIIQILQIWKNEQIFNANFINQVCCYIMPQFEASKEAYFWSQQMISNQNQTFDISNLNDNQQAKQLFQDQMNLVNRFPETRQAVLQDASAQRLQINDKLAMFNAQIQSYKTADNQDQDTKSKLIAELNELREEQINYIQESFQFIYNFSNLVQRNASEVESANDPDAKENPRSIEIQNKLQQFEQMVPQIQQ